MKYQAGIANWGRVSPVGPEYKTLEEAEKGIEKIMDKYFSDRTPGVFCIYENNVSGEIVWSRVLN